MLKLFVIHIKGFYEDIAHHVEKLLDTSMIRMIKIPLPTDKNKKLMGLFKDKLGGKIMKEFVGLTYLMDDDTEYKKEKETKKCIMKRRLVFKYYKYCLFNDKIILQSQQSDYHNVYTEKINNITLSSNDDKRLQTFDKITTYPHGTIAFKVCKSERLSKI